MSTVYIIYVPLKIDLRFLNQDDCCFPVTNGVLFSGPLRSAIEVFEPTVYQR